MTDAKRLLWSRVRGTSRSGRFRSIVRNRLAATSLILTHPIRSLTLEFSRVIPSVSEESAVGKNGGKRCHSAKKAVFAGIARSCESKGRRGPCPRKTPRRSGPCPRHGTSDFDGTLAGRRSSLTGYGRKDLKITVTWPEVRKFRMNRKYPDRSGLCPRHGTSDFDGTLAGRRPPPGGYSAMRYFSSTGR
jgi:hypothetical protein